MLRGGRCLQFTPHRRWIFVFIGAAYHGAGTSFKVHQDIFTYVYDTGKVAGKREAVGEVLYNRGLISAMFEVEAIRTAMTRYGNKPPTGEQVRWGFEHLNLTEKRLEELGMKGFTHPLKVTCEDHEGAGPVMFLQWDGKKFEMLTDWVAAPDPKFIRKLIEDSAAKYAVENKITPRSCS